MAVTKYHNITGSTGVNVELLAPGAGVNNISSIVIGNTHASNDATVSIYIKDHPSSGQKTFYIAKTLAIPAKASLVLDSNDIPNFDNSHSTGYGLYATVGSSDTLDILIN